MIPNNELHHEGSMKYKLSYGMYEINVLKISLVIEFATTSQEIITHYKLELINQTLPKEVRTQFQDIQKIYSWLHKKNNFEIDPFNGKLSLIIRVLEKNEAVQNKLQLQLIKCEQTKKQYNLNSFKAHEMEIFNSKIKNQFYQIGVWTEEIERRRGEMEMVSVDYQDGRYEGEVKNGRRNGYGIFRNEANRQIYSGQWKNDRKHGKGILIDQKDESTLKGNFEYGYASGYGIQFHEDGVRRQGFWKEGKLDGISIIYWTDSTKTVEKYLDGEKIEKSKLQNISGELISDDDLE